MKKVRCLSMLDEALLCTLEFAKKTDAIVQDPSKASFIRAELDRTWIRYTQIYQSYCEELLHVFITPIERSDLHRIMSATMQLMQQFVHISELIARGFLCSVREDNQNTTGALMEVVEELHTMCTILLNRKGSQDFFQRIRNVYRKLHSIQLMCDSLESAVQTRGQDGFRMHVLCGAFTHVLQSCERLCMAMEHAMIQNI